LVDKPIDDKPIDDKSTVKKPFDKKLMVKKILRISLLSAVILSFAYFIYTEITVVDPVLNEAHIEEVQDVDLLPNRVEVAYLIFGKRCVTCKTIERYTREAVTTTYGKDILAGLVQWRLIDCDEPKNKHYLSDFELVSKAVYVFRYENNELIDHENLKEIWTKCSDKKAYFAYISEWVDIFLDCVEGNPERTEPTVATEKFWEKGIMLGLIFSLWLGILTSIAPCPLATNIAAVSFIGKNVVNPRKVFASGAFYTLGRVIAYVVLALLLVSALLSASNVSLFFQNYMNKILGPTLVIAGMFFVGLLSFGFSTSFGAEKMRKLAEKGGLLTSLIIGIVFALSFCPVSAAFFFLTLIPVALKYESGILLPSIYGIGTGLPVLIFAILVALGSKKIAAAFDKISVFEKWSRWITGVVFILVGLYMSLEFIFGCFK